MGRDSYFIFSMAAPPNFLCGVPFSLYKFIITRFRQIVKCFFDIIGQHNRAKKGKMG